MADREPRPSGFGSNPFRWRPVVLVVAAALLIGGAASGHDPGLPPGGARPTAVSFDGVPEVGALFLGETDGPHACTGSVVRSDDSDLVITAAHCLSGTGQGMSFVPGYRGGLAPYGTWQVTAIYADPRWISVQDPQHDYAFLVLAPQRRGGHPVRLRQTVRGDLLGAAPIPGRPVTVPAYVEGQQDLPIICTAPAYVFQGYPAFDCHGYDTGVSGAPFLVRGPDGPVVRGVIGGLHQGGCFEDTSYSSWFDADTLALYRRAEDGDHPDTLPDPGDGDC
jgi:hypothetical protein